MCKVLSVNTRNMLCDVNISVCVCVCVCAGVTAMTAFVTPDWLRLTTKGQLRGRGDDMDMLVQVCVCVSTSENNGWLGRWLCE